MEMVLRVVTTIIGTAIGASIGAGVCSWFINRRDEKEIREHIKVMAPIIQPNVDFIDEMNSESNIQADMQSLRDLPGKEQIQ